MSMTVPQLARELHLTSQAVQQRMRKIPDFVVNYTRKPHRTRIVNDKGVHILKNHTSVDSKGHRQRRQNKLTDELIAQLRDEIKYSHERERHSSKQVDELNEQINRITLTTANLYKRYDQSQNNLRSEQSKVQRYRDKVDLLRYKETNDHNRLIEYKKSHPSNNSLNDKMNHLIKSINKPAKSKHGWIYRFFHK